MYYFIIMRYFILKCLLPMCCLAYKIYIQDHGYNIKLCIKNGVERYLGKSSNILLFTDKRCLLNFPIIQNPHVLLSVKYNFDESTCKYQSYVVLVETFLTLKVVK